MSLSEGRYTGEFLVSEADGDISRSSVTVTVAAATKLSPGQVVGKLAATGKYVPVDDTATDGSETAAGVLFEELDNSAGLAGADFPAVVIDWTAAVRADDLIWGSSDSVEGLAELRALGIKAR